ncbi:MAG: hypothetical protein R3F11_10290 [Verrucomicrobiales bacterium]
MVCATQRARRGRPAPPWVHPLPQRVSTQGVYDLCEKVDGTTGEPGAQADRDETEVVVSGELKAGNGARWNALAMLAWEAAQFRAGKADSTA